MAALSSICDRFLQILQRPGSATFATGGVALFAAFIIAYRDYRSYVSMGPHGLPDTFQGWIKQLKMSKFARKDVTAPAPYANADEIAKALGPNANISFFSVPLKSRPTVRPTIPNFVAPQRQTSQLATESRKAQMSEYLDHLTAKNPSLLHRGLSKLEGPVPALQVHPSKTIPSYLKRTKGEMVHVHPPDGSSHMVLSLADSKEVIEKGWGQRHRLSGSLVPWSYTLIYAPQDEGEFEVWKAAVDAAIGFGMAEIRDPLA